MEYILNSENYKKAETVFSFVSMGSEVETKDILEQAWKDGKTVAVPKTGKGRVMVFLKIESFADLQKGRFGVMEPVTEAELIPGEDDLFLVPGALFDRKKNRIGYGGGYYDRFIKKHPHAILIGVGYDFQLVEEVPVLRHDQKMHRIILPSQTIQVSSAEPVH